jgi:hypothetical protein
MTHFHLWKCFSSLINFAITFKKWTKDLNRHFSEEDVKGHQGQKKILSSLSEKWTSKPQWNITMSHLLGWLLLKKQRLKKYWWGCAKIGTLQPMVFINWWIDKRNIYKCIMEYLAMKKKWGPGPGAHAYNPSYVGGRVRRIMVLQRQKGREVGLKW